jgi:hypothetical protein
MYLEGAQFEPEPEHWIFWALSWFSIVPLFNFLKLAQFYSSQDPFQFNIHHHSLNGRYIVWVIVVKNQKEREK